VSSRDHQNLPLEIAMPSVAEMIQALAAHGMSNEAIAQALGKSMQAVSSWATGKVANPHRATREGIETLYRSVVGAGAGEAFPFPAATAIPEEDVAQTPSGSSRFSATSDSQAAVEPTPLPVRRTSPPPRAPAEAFRFIHCADLHIDSPLKGLQKIDPRYAEWIRTATREAFKRLVGMAIADQVNFVVIAGDLYDGDWKSADTGIFVSRQLRQLADAGIPVFAITGNHDALSVVTRSVRWPETARRFAETAESIEIPDLGVVIHGRSFGDRHESSDFVTAYPAPQAGMFNLGLLHTSLGGGEGHATYAPCSPAQLTAIGYDYWALGHVHVPRVVQSAPHIVYSGNIQGRDIGETGPRGCYVVTVDGGRNVATHFVELDDVRWERIEVAVGDIGAATIDDVVAAAIDTIEPRVPADERLLACRVVLTGETPLHRRLITRRGSLREDVVAVVDSQLERVCVEQVTVETSDPENASQPHADVPGRARDLLDDEFDKLQATEVDALLGEVPELKKLFDDLRVLDSVKAGQREELHATDSWKAFVTEARDLLAAELAGPAAGGEGTP
jgi:DNA repair protein SbcD/Mre11